MQHGVAPTLTYTPIAFNLKDMHSGLFADICQM